jgi:rSAM/selenodomain-associated transferase 1
MNFKNTTPSKGHAIIIFVRNPILGKVKSRLAATVGKERALGIYTILLKYTDTICKHLSADTYVFYEDFVNHDDMWEEGIYQKKLQEGNSLGDRMQHAFRNVFKHGYQKVVIIGSDCYELTSAIITESFEALSLQDVVIGPAADGGYYLLGMKKCIREIFDNNNWGGSTLYEDTVRQLKEGGYTYRSLIELNDVDVESDIDFSKLNTLDAK